MLNICSPITQWSLLLLFHFSAFLKRSHKLQYFTSEIRVTNATLRYVTVFYSFRSTDRPSERTSPSEERWLTTLYRHYSDLPRNICGYNLHQQPCKADKLRNYNNFSKNYSLYHILYIWSHQLCTWSNTYSSLRWRFRNKSWLSLCYRRHPYFYRSGIRNIRVQKLQDKKNDDFFFFCFLFCFFFICWGGHEMS